MKTAFGGVSNNMSGLGSVFSINALGNQEGIQKTFDLLAGRTYHLEAAGPKSAPTLGM